MQLTYDELKKNIPVYEKLLNSLKQTEDVEEFYNVIKDKLLCLVIDNTTKYYQNFL